MSNVNAPLLSDPERLFGVDLWGRFGGAWLDGSVGADRLQIAEHSYSVGSNVYLNHWEGVRPWVGLGYMFANNQQRLTSGGTTSVTKDSFDALRLSVGAESILTKHIAVRTSFEFLFDDIKVSELKDPRFLTEFVITPTDHWYFRVGGSVDFNGNAGVLAGVGIKY